MAVEIAVPPGPVRPAPEAENVKAGVLWMLASGLCFVGMTGGVRYLGPTLPTAESAFIRYFFGLLIVSPALIGMIRTPPARGILARFGLRGLLHGFAVMLWFYAMARIPVAEVTALGYVTPIFITILAAIFLGERLRARRIAAIFCGLAGVLIILRPGFQEIGSGQLAQLATAPLFAVSFILAKELTKHAKPTEIVAMLSLGCTITLLPFALTDWKTPSLHDVTTLALVAAFATAGHYAQTLAYKSAPITVTQPVTFLQIVWATTLGAVAFGEPVDVFIVIGAGVIVGSAWYIAIREIRAKARSRGAITGTAPR